MVKQKKRYRGKIVNHGSICYKILYENSQDIDCSFHCIEVISNNEKRGNVKNLLIALEWCLINNIQIISLSIGTRNAVDGKLLNDITKKLYESGIIVVAAFNNHNTLTYPAAFENVIGVCIDKDKIIPTNRYIYLDNNEKNIDIIARYDFNDIEKSIGVQIGDYNSYIVPFIVSVILKIKSSEDYVSSKNVRKYLKKYSV